METRVFDQSGLGARKITEIIIKNKNKTQHNNNNNKTNNQPTKQNTQTKQNKTQNEKQNRTKPPQTYRVIKKNNPNIP